MSRAQERCSKVCRNDDMGGVENFGNFGSGAAFDLIRCEVGEIMCFPPFVFMQIIKSVLDIYHYHYYYD